MLYTHGAGERGLLSAQLQSLNVNGILATELMRILSYAKAMLTLIEIWATLGF